MAEYINSKSKLKITFIIIGSIIFAIYYRSKMHSSGYLALPDKDGNYPVKDFSFLLILIGVLVLVFGLPSKLMDIRRLLASPRKKAVKFMKKYVKNPFLALPGFASSELRDFRDWLMNNSNSTFKWQSSLEEIDDKLLNKVYEFKNPPRDVIDEKIEELIHLLVIGVWLLTIGLILS